MDVDDDFLTSCSRNDVLQKQPFRRLEFAINQVTRTAIPFHVQLLKEQSKNIECFRIPGKELQLHSEQIKAANTVRLLKSDLHQLEQINTQVKDEDCEKFQRKIETPTRDVIEVLSEFMELNSDILQPFLELDDTEDGENFNTTLKINFEETHFTESNSLPPIAAYELDCQHDQIIESRSMLKHWSNLKKELFEINELIKKFAGFVFAQQDQVNAVESNVLQARENVNEGTKHLKKAAIFKAASIPLAGAVIGGLLLGPIGALAGFKLVGSAVCAAGGGILGYGAGCKVKKQKLTALDIEMKALTYPSKSLSLSTPELSSISENILDENKNKEE